MGFSHGYGAFPAKDESIRLMRMAYDLGCTLFDTAEAYGPFINEELVGEAVKPFRDKIILTTKFSPYVVPGQDISGEKLSRHGIRKALEDSLKRLQTDYVDLYYQHRVPPTYCPQNFQDRKIPERFRSLQERLSPPSNFR